MKAMTLDPVRAALVREGVLRVVPRPTATDWRGEVAIHAANRRPDFQTMKRLIAGDPDVWNVWFAAGLVSEDGSTDFIPVGAVVATAQLVDVLPIVETDDPVNLRGVLRWIEIDRPDDPDFDPDTCMSIWSVRDPSDLEYVQHETITAYKQEPYGDFSPGMWAWLLEDIEPIDPVPARGRAGLWEWTT